MASAQKSSAEAGQRAVPMLTYFCSTDPYSHNEAEKTGWAATRTKLFRLRSIVAVLALITFAVMSSAPYIRHRDFKPNHHFHRGCTFKGDFVGIFNFRGYQTVIAVGVICFVHNVAQMVLYTLPVDKNGHKHIPGAAQFLARVLKSPHRANAVAAWCAEFGTAHGTFIEVLMDGLLLIMAVVSFAVSQYLFETAVPATVFLKQENSYQSIAVEEYYTLSTCYLTYSHKTPACLDAGLNPTGKIRASLVFLFFAAVFQLLCFMSSLRKFHAHGYSSLADDVQPDSPSYGEAPAVTGSSAAGSTMVPNAGGGFLTADLAIDTGTRTTAAQGLAQGTGRVSGTAPAVAAVYSMVNGDEMILEEHSV